MLEGPDVPSLEWRRAPTVIGVSPMLRTALIVLAVLLPATPATAATVSLSAANGLTFRAAGGEANDVSVELGRSAVVVRDAGAALTPRGRCRTLDAQAVRCTFGEELSGFFDLGDGNDRLSFPPGPVDNAVPTFAGGAGDDEIAGIGYLEGGAGDDRLTRTTATKKWTTVTAPM